MAISSTGKRIKTGVNLTAWLDGSKLVFLRGDRKQYLVASDCRMANSRLSQYEKFAHPAPLDDILRLARYYKVSPRSLLMPESVTELHTLSSVITNVLSDGGGNDSSLSSSLVREIEPQPV